MFYPAFLSFKNMILRKVVFRAFLKLMLTSPVFVMPLEAADVKIKGEEGKWVLEVNSKPFYIQGAGCGLARGKKGEDYLKLAKELGANCVRTWGIDQGTKEYLDLAAQYGLLVDAGIWLNYADLPSGISYIGDTAYKQRKRKEIIEYVSRFKEHPAVAFWNVGNEAIFFTRDEREKAALCQFLESVIQEIHKIDPRHPVIYTSSLHFALPYLKKYVPSLDAIGMNVYGSIRSAHGSWDYLGMHKPYIITEYGPYLSQDCQKDDNGKAVELRDEQKALLYKKFAADISEFKGYNLGGFVFHLGETTQETLTWWNINYGLLKKPSFWAIYTAYTGKPCPYPLPKIRKFTVSKDKGLKPEEIITLETEVTFPEPESLVFSYLLSTTEENVLKYYVNDSINTEVTGSGCKVTMKAPENEGVYRVYVFVSDGKGNVASANKTISVGR